MRKFLLAILLIFYASTIFAADNDKDIDQMLGSMLMLGFRGTELVPDTTFYQYLASGKIGNVILFDRDVTLGSTRNIGSPEQLAKLTASIRQTALGPIFIGVDQEGGQVRRLKPQKGFMDLPAAQVLGQGNQHATQEIADRLGKELSQLGINLDFAPVVDVDVNPFNPSIGRLGRSFSPTAATVAQHALAFGLGLAKNGVAPCLKHFPGIGCAREDSHLVLPDISQCWHPEVDLLPYSEILRTGWPGMIMVGHVLHTGFDKDNPASLAKKIVTGLLRNGLGWQGVIISDDLQMKAIKSDLKETLWLAIDAGIDILLLGNNLEWDPELPQKAWKALKDLMDEGRLTKERVAESWQRISALHSIYPD